MQKRAVALFSIICVGLGALLWRTMLVGNTLATDALQASHVRTLTVGTSRGKIYDRGGDLLVDEAQRLFAAIAPCAAASEELRDALGAEAAQALLESGAPTVAEVTREINTDFMRTFSVPVRYGASTPATHLVGRVDSSGSGVSGIEKAYDGFLKENGGALYVRFEVDAAGRVLPGADKEIVDQNYQSRAGVVLTLDRTIQRMTETALERSGINSGCALVMAADGGDILAMASKPSYDRSAPETALNAADAPLTNKALSAYSVGSVFKPLVAAFALEHGIDATFTYTCTGACRIGDTTFQCYDEKAHGKETMKEALANSCNTYFIRLFSQLDTGAFLSFCRHLGFGSALTLCDGIVCDGGMLPDAADLRLPGERANFAFGQGKLLASPVQMLSLYHVLATGQLVAPTVLLGFSDAEERLTLESQPPTQTVLSAPTVRTLRKLLRFSAEQMENSKAKSDRTTVAGKTGTAQSGSYTDGKEICRTWFAGFFPADAPQYIVLVLDENGVSGNADCAPVFKEICEKISEYVASG